MGILSRSICLSCTDKKKEKKFGDSGVGALFQGRLAIYHLRHCANHPQPNLNNYFNILTSIKQNKNNYCSKTKFWNSLFFYTFQTDWEHLFRAKHLEPLPKCVVASFNFHLSKGYYGAVVFPSSSLACGAINQSAKLPSILPPCVGDRV